MRRDQRRCGRTPLPYAVHVTRVVLRMGVACIAAAGAGVLQLSNPGVLASIEWKIQSNEHKRAK
eukprot:2759442-Pleurochrysis_carterae.AAC.1